MNPDLRRALSTRRIILVGLSVAVCALLVRSGIYHWYFGPPDTLFFHRTARNFCLRCGAQALSRDYEVFGSRIFRTSRNVIGPIVQCDQHDCAKNEVIVASDDRFIKFGTWKPTRFIYGKIEDHFWLNPTLVHVLTSIEASHPYDAEALTRTLLRLHINSRIPPPLQAALNGTNSAALRQALYDATPDEKLLGRYPPPPNISSNTVTTPKPPM